MRDQGLCFCDAVDFDRSCRNLHQPPCLCRSLSPTLASGFRKAPFRHKNRNCNRRLHKDHSSLGHNNPKEHSLQNNIPLAEHRERIRRCNSRRRIQLPTSLRMAKDSTRWLNRTSPRKHQSSKLSLSIASLSKRLAAAYRRKKRPQLP